MKGNNDRKYQLQGSIYRWLNPEIITNDYMNIQFIFTDWSKLRASIEAKKGYPKSRVLAHPIELLSIKEIEDWMKAKLQIIYDLTNVAEDKMPDCTQEELWQGDAQYKYFKNPNGKRATKNFDDYYLANEKLVEDGSVGVVKTVFGKVRACKYCAAFEVCNQKEIYRENGTLEL